MKNYGGFDYFMEIVIYKIKVFEWIILYNFEKLRDLSGGFECDIGFKRVIII